MRALIRFRDTDPSWGSSEPGPGQKQGGINWRGKRRPLPLLHEQDLVREVADTRPARGRGLDVVGSRACLLGLEEDPETWQAGGGRR